MIRKTIVTIAGSGLLLNACGEEPVDMDDEVAEFQGEQIKAEDVVYQYSFTEEHIEDYLKELAVVNEAQSLGIEVNGDQIAEHRSEMYPGLEKEDESAFFEQQAEELSVAPEDYYDEWADTFVERDLYLQLYVQEKFDNPQTDEEVEAWSKELETHIDELFADYKANGDIVIY